MARWKKLMLASALVVWPAVCSAQGLGDANGGAAPTSRPGLFDTGRTPTSMSDAALRRGAVVAPSASGMPVPESVVPASHLSGCGDKSGCGIGCDAAGGNWGVTSMSTDGPSGFVVMGEYLYMKMRRADPVVLATTVDVDGNVRGDLVDYATDYTSAFRVGAGYLARSGWLFTGTYTRFEDESKPQLFAVDSPGGEQSILYVGPGVFASDIQFNEGVLGVQWKMEYQTLDLMIGAVISPSSCLDIIVNMGARVADIRQSYFTAADITPAVPTELRERLDLDIRGAGPRVGTEARLYLAKCFMLYGRSYASLLLANREEQSFSSTNDFNALTTRHITYTREEILPMFELGAGMEASLCEGQVLIGAGYEWNYLFEMGSTNVDFASNAKFNRHVNLSLDGFVAKVCFLW